MLTESYRPTVYQQIQQLPYYPHSQINPPATLLAAELAELLPGDLKHVYFCNSGSEANETAIKIAPNFAIAHYNLGLTHRARGYLDPAIAAYQQAIRLQPDYAEAYQNLGAVFFKLGKLPESRVAFERAITLHQTYNPDEAQRLRQGLKKLGLNGIKSHKNSDSIE